MPTLIQAQKQSSTQTTIDVEHAMEEYLGQRDWRIQANANQGYSLGGLILNVAGKVTVPSPVVPATFDAVTETAPHWM